MKLRARVVETGFDTKTIAAAVRNDFRDAVFDSCMRIEATAKQNCAVHFGELRANIKTRFTNDGMLGSVGTDVAHGPFVEFGTGRRGAASGVIIPQDVEYAYGHKSGMPAQPFLFPALEQERPTFQQNVRDVGRNLGKT